MAETGIKEFGLNQLNPADYNPRRISNEAMEGLKKSLDRFGCVEPIVVNTRVKAAENRGKPAN